MSDTPNPPDQTSPEEDDESNFVMERVTDHNIKENYIFRLLLIGNSNVGKTSLLNRFCDSTYNDDCKATIGVDFKVVTLKYKDKIIKVHVWDTAGQERFKSVAVNYYRTANVFIFVYDITNDTSFNDLENWIDLAFSNNKTSVINFLVGNKIDEENNRKIDKNVAVDFANSKNLIYFEASAKNDENVTKIFEMCTYKLIKYFEKNKDKYRGEGDLKLGNSTDIGNNEKKKGCNC